MLWMVRHINFKLHGDERTMPSNIWTPFGCSVRGASHIREDKENQDNVFSHQGLKTADGKKTPSIVAVSDGHGGDKYIRSAMGSHLAVTLAAKMVAEDLQLSSKMRKDELFGTIRHIKSRYLLAWQTSVDEHAKQNPFGENDKSFLKEKCKQKDYDAVLSNPRLAYGCTFLCAIGYDDLVLILQLGDGDVLGLDTDGTVRELIKSDFRNFGNETLSLCSFRERNNVEDKQVIIAHEVLVGNEIPELITLTTDGVKNSFDDLTSDIEAFYKIPIAIKNALQENNYDAEKVKIDLEEKLLHKAANAGSGDDVTIGVLFKNIREAGKDETKN